MPHPNSRQNRPDPALWRELGRRIRRLEGAAARTAGALALGIPEIDGALPWGGLPRGVLNEVLGVAHGGGQGPALTAAAGFAAALIGRAGDGVVLWCRRGGGLYGPGLAGLGLDPGRLIVAHGRNETDILWAMEEGLRGAALAAVVGEVAGSGPVALRRLQLAAEAGGVLALLLRAGAAREAPSPAATRWRVAAAASASTGRWPGPPRWRVELLKCRGGTFAADRPKTWIVEWRGKSATATPDDEDDGKGDDKRRQEGIEAGGFAVAAELRHRPLAAAGEGRQRRRLEI